jgi:hypothetical protein
VGHRQRQGDDEPRRRSWPQAVRRRPEKGLQRLRRPRVRQGGWRDGGCAGVVRTAARPGRQLRVQPERRRIRLHRGAARAVTGGPQQVLGQLEVGDAYQTWLGPSWSDGKLFFYESSEGSGDPSRASIRSTTLTSRPRQATCCRVSQPSTVVGGITGRARLRQPPRSPQARASSTRESHCARRPMPIAASSSSARRSRSSRPTPRARRRARHRPAAADTAASHACGLSYAPGPTRTADLSLRRPRTGVRRRAVRPAFPGCCPGRDRDVRRFAIDRRFGRRAAAAARSAATDFPQVASSYTGQHAPMRSSFSGLALPLVRCARDAISTRGTIPESDRRGAPSARSAPGPTRTADLSLASCLRHATRGWHTAVESEVQAFSGLPRDGPRSDDHGDHLDTDTLRSRKPTRWQGLGVTSSQRKPGGSDA